MGMLTSTYKSKAIKLCQLLLNDIGSGEFPPGTLLPAQDELARKYSVSRNTIYRVLSILNVQGKVQKLAQGKILVPTSSGTTQAGFAEDSSRKPKTERKLSVAAVWSVVMDHSMTMKLEGIREYCEIHNLSFANYLSPKGHEATLQILREIDSYSVDGVILYPYQDESYTAVIRELLDRRLPVVGLRPVGDLPLSTVFANDEAGAFRVTHYLAEKYRRPVYYIAEVERSEVTTERHRGWVLAMRDSGFEDVIKDYLFRMEYVETDPSCWALDKKWLPGLWAGERLLGKIELPASIFCVNDNVARGVYAAAQAKGLAIGKDLFIAGFDDMSFAKYLKPGLTTIRTQKKENGYEAAKLLHRLMLQKNSEPVSIRLPVELVVRESA